MTNKEKRTPNAIVTDLILLWLFRHGWEDPGWGQSQMGQIAAATVMHELAQQINDLGTRKQMQTLAAKVMSDAVKQMSSIDD